MKRLILVAICALGALSFSNAQERVVFGIKGGGNYAMFRGEDSDNFDSKVDFHLGFVALARLSEKWAIQPEFLYTSQGTTITENNIDFDVDVDYLAVPVLLKYYITDNFSVEAGPQLGLLVNDKLEGRDIDAEIFDLSANLGLGYQLENGLFFQARYNMGFTDVFQMLEVNNSVFQLSVGYLFL
ncbi:porin family protein [Ascidiimonas aurantiaca]|uniref:porin family protein n=1 Tax=Ascidiimonas aurantiaca TaxID=1685432 RepID=UPI0030ECE451